MAQPPVMKISNVPMVASVQARPSKIAVGMDLAKIQLLVREVADEQAPHFVQANAPLSDGPAFRAVGGALYYRPRLRVAQRAAPAFGPEVRFLKDADGKVRLVFELEEDRDPSLPAEAQPLGVRVDSVALRWNGGQRVFHNPTLLEDAPPDAATPAFSIRCGGELDPGEVEALNGALSNPGSGAQIHAALSFGYYIDTTSVVPTPVKPPPKFRRPPVILRTRRLAPFALSPMAFVATEQPMTSAGVAAVGATTLIAAEPALAGEAFFSLRSRAVLTSTVAQILERRRTRSDFFRASITRAIPFTFDPALEQNRLVFAGIRAGEVVREVWSETAFGYVRKAPYPNTIYCMPQELRLAFNPEMGTAHVVPHLYRDAEDEVRVRLTLRAVPWFDTEKVVALCDHLYRATGGALASPHVIAGGYQRASLHLTTAFPEQIKLVSDGAASIDLSGGVDLTLDVTLEFYRFIAQMLAGPIGIVGEVRVVLEEAAGSEGQSPSRLERNVAVRLRLDSFANLPIEVMVEDEAVRPDEITIRNNASSMLTIGGCLPRLLQWDSNSVVPLEVFDADPEGAFPRTIEANQAVKVKIEPRVAGEEMLWNAVDVSLARTSLDRSGAQALERIHELAPSGTLTWRLNVECPVFQRSPLPAEFGDLFRVEVQLSRQGFAAQQVILGKDQATGNVTMQRTLQDLMSTEGGDNLAFRYRVRNVYFARAGSWSEEQAGEGSNLFVFPNPVASD